MDSTNYLVIQGWMRTELNLKGNDLLVYAIIYGFSQSENQKFTGSLQYLADWCGATKTGIQNNLKNLLEKNLIAKEESHVNNVKFVAYYTTQLHTIQLSCTNNISNNKLLDNYTNSNLLSNDNKITTKPKKDNLYTKCVNAINEKTSDERIRKLLINWLNLLLEKYRDRNKSMYYNVFKSKLDTLDVYDRKDWEDIISYNIDKGYEKFYPIPLVYNRKTLKADNDVVGTRYEEDDFEELRKLEEWRASNGFKTKF